MTTQQPEAMQLAFECEESAFHWVNEIDTRSKAAKMLRAQHARIEDLEAQHREELRAYEITVANREARIAELEVQLEAIGAGGVEPLRKPAAAPQAVQAAVPDAPIGQTGKYKSGDRIVCTNAVNAKFITEGREYVAGIMGRNPGGVFVVADDGEESEYRADRFIAAPAHPAEGVPAQIETLRSELAEEKEAADNWRRLALQFDNHRLQALWHLKRILHEDSSVDEYKAAEQFLAAPPLDGEAVLAQRIAALAATQPAAQGMDAEIQQAVEAERERICAAIKAEDDHCVDQGDYMLDSNDCIKIVRGKWVRPDYSLDAAQAKQGGAANG